MGAVIFWAVVLVVAHVFAQLSVRDFVKAWGENLFTAAGARRRDAGMEWALWYGLFGGMVAYGGSSGPKASDITLALGWVVFVYGFTVAWRLGEARELATMTRDIREKTALRQFQQGVFNPPPPPPPPIDPEKEARGVVKWLENVSRQSGRPVSQQELDDTYDYYKARYVWERDQAAPAQARLVDAQVTFNSSDSVPARAVAQQHEGLFAFDPARFKLRDPSPQASPALPRGDQWQSPPRQPAPPAQTMPSLTYDGSKVWR